MEWILIALLVIAVIVLVSIYRRSLNDSRALRSVAILVLLRDEAYQIHRKGLIEFVHRTEAKDAFQLASKVLVYFDDMALRLQQSSVGGAHVGALWQLKQQLDKQ